MKQILIKKGRALVAEVEPPHGQPGRVLVATAYSCISPGTEMSSVRGSGKSLVRRVMDQPGKALEAAKRAQAGGLSAIWAKARQAVEREATCGYSAAGVVLDVGPGVSGFHAGMEVAIAGVGHANHAEICSVPENLTVPVPAGVTLAAASTVALGAIAMQGVRRAEVAIGESVAVVGCGALGMLAIQMLKAAGCRVLAIDLDSERLALAHALGADATLNPTAEDPVAFGTHWSGGHGVDAVLLMTATRSSEPLSQAFRLCRRKGRVVLVGTVGPEFQREDMYVKELELRISTSYGPGRYDDHYELDGQDYPYGYVRWTEKRNMESYLALIAARNIDLGKMIGLTVPVDEADRAYSAFNGPDKPMLAVIQYPPNLAADEEPAPPKATRPAKSTAGSRVAVIGGGSFFKHMHLPILQSMAGNFQLVRTCARSAPSARAAAAGIDGCIPGTDADEVFADETVDLILIATRHDTHGKYVAAGLRAGKSVFVEKPLCLTPEEFTDIGEALRQTQGALLVGYNRRFSPQAREIREAVAARANPLMIQYIMNAGHIDAGHWTHGREGGGRLMGEACHLVDLFRFLVGHPVASFSVHPLRGITGDAGPLDNFSLTIDYQDGSVANLIYTAQGPRSWPKEHMKVFWDEKAMFLTDYIKLEGHGLKVRNAELKSQDKGHRNEWLALRDALRSGERFPIPWEELEETWKVCYQADQICRRGELPLA
jgi:predicted dehydrogenase/threonine dehydrogenase-like Zn-dependent dehydrogenase